MSLQARYTIVRKIADGGTAEIFLANQRGDHGFEKLVVLKRIFPAFYADPEFRGMLVNEAHIAMSLNHSNIVQVLDLGEDEGQYILALELVDGWTLDAVIRRVRAARSTLPPALALHVTGEVCRALSYAHAKTDADGKPLGIVHRDISPHNVLLSEQGEVKLTDFGIATAQNQRDKGGEKVIQGKIAYMSPEQASGDPMDARSDLFSVGTMLYVMVCGRYPFDARTDLEMLLLVKSGQFVPPETARPGLHPDVARMLRRMMAKDVADRYQSADEILADVEQVMRSAFRSVGQTELKRWLQDLSIRDGVPALTKAPPAVVTSHAGRVVGRGTGPKVEKSDQAAPSAVAAPGTGPHRVPPPVPPGARVVSSSVRPPPPRAALTAGRKPGSPTGPVPTLAAPDVTLTDASGPAHLSLDNVPLLDDASLDLEPDTDEQTVETETVVEKKPEPPRGPPGPLSPSLVALSSGATVPPPSTVVPPPPTAASPLDAVPPPPVAAEILAAVGSSGTPGGFGSGRGAIAASSVAAREPSAFPGSLNELPRPGRSRLGLVLGLGLSGALALFVSIKTCTSRHGQEVAGGPPASAPEGKKPEVRPTAVTSPAPTIGAVPGRDAGAPTAEVGNAAVIATAGDAQAAGEAGARAASAGLADADSGGKRAENEIATAPEGATREPTAAGKTEPAHPDAAAVVPAGTAPPPTAPAVAVVSPASRAPAPSPSPSPPAEVAVEAPRPVTGAAPSPGRERPPSAVDPAGVAPAASPGAGSGTDAPSESSAEGQKVMVLINSIPPGARVTTAHHDYGTTPLSIRLKAGNAYAFFLKYDGYRTTKQHVDVTAEPDQEVTVTLKKGSGAPAEVAASAATSAPSPSAPPTPAAAPPGAKPADGSWWQKMFKKR
jgi:serine/threonine protein kinase